MSKRHKYEASTGQVFLETSIPVARRNTSDWIGDYKTSSLVRKSAYRHDHGARSLQDMAKVLVARNMRSLTANHLQDVPWDVAESLWEEVVSIRGESFHAWRVLASSHGDKFTEPKHRYFIELRRPPLPFTDYFTGITSRSLDWLVCVRISPKYVDKADLVKLANIPNLACLDLSDSRETIEISPSRFDERVLRAWSELALEKGAFKQLRALLFGWQPVSTWIFKYLNSFSALRIVITTACPDFGQWNRKDWEPLATNVHWEARHAKNSVQTMRPIVNDEKFCHGAISSILYRPEVARRMPPKPVLECWLTGPPPWENVVRDFPKVTQTVWLEKTEGAPAVSRDTMAKDQCKRLRDAEASTKGNRSPPPKRTNAQMRPTPTTAADLLADFTGGN